MSPSTWLVGAAGFLARGGILVLALPILSLPTPVGVTLLIPPLSVTTSGVSSVFVPELVALGLALAGIVVVALLLGALADAVAYEHVTAAARVGDATPAPAASGLPGDARSRAAPRGATPALVGRLVAVELVALVPAAVAAIVTTGRLIAVGNQEYLLPSSIDVPYAVRVLRGASEAVLVLAVCLLLADVANALLSRRVLRHAFGRTDPPGPRGLQRPVRIAATWLGAWLVTLASLVPGLAAIELTWPGVRDAYTLTMSRQPPAPAVLVLVTAVFVAAWVAAVVVAGLGSAIRTVLWSHATAP
jgi:hypothetical protein